ncbi:poly(ethylene terephthalate) hydrolase family protein [Micromonospora carbonacea]|uniref:poly(ethylene terephthalate) hydrolase family protein n=1 Tax=Micromonospora carbonacea TaxID=47853 RepID=UPI0017C3E597|nr:alpha/beta hydrolase [Micromonospora carbonacea]MBB5824964.1 dienelactone hydrolase [Micromonospora carbonacea]
MPLPSRPSSRRPSRPRPGPRRRWRPVALTALLALTVGHAAPARAADNPYERGPAPTVASIEAPRGPFAVADAAVAPSAVTGFGGGTMWYPTSTAEGTFGAVAIAPGYKAGKATIAWLGPRLASQGFVVLTIDTLTPDDPPDSRGTQLLAALDYLVGASVVRNRIDHNRLAVMGHSLGGGGSLSAANTRPTLQAAISLTGWHTTKNWPGVRVPTFIVGAEDDEVAPVALHSELFYSTLPATLDKAYLELDGATHATPTAPNVTIAKYGISWLKRFVDDDTRYEQFLCPAPSDATIEEYRDTCPHS